MGIKNLGAIAGVTAALCLPGTMAQAQQPINVTVDGDVVAFAGQQPVEQFGSVLVPLRGVFEKLGATVAYDGGTRSILAVRGPTTVTLKLGSRDAQVNNTTRTLSVPAQAVNGTTLVPLRFVSEALGANVNWQAASRTVIVSTSGGSSETVTPTPPVPTDPIRVAPGDRYTYGRITFDYDLGNFRVGDRAALEAQIRRNLNNNPGSPLVKRRQGSGGTLDVNVSMERVSATSVRATVRLGLNPDGRGASALAATESATMLSRDNNVDEQVVLQAFRKARRELTVKVNQDARRR